MTEIESDSVRLGFIPGLATEALLADFPGVLQTLRKAGYSAIELVTNVEGVTGMDAAGTRRVLDDLGFACSSFFAVGRDFGENTSETIDTALALDASHIVWGWASPENEHLMKETLPQMKEAAAAVREAGLTLVYHNHAHEFLNERDGQCSYHWLMDQFTPEEIAIELDVGWVAYGRHDNVETIRRYAGRVPILHLRDIADPAEHGAFVEVGDGVLDLASILEAGARIGGARWAIVEHTKPLQMEPVAGLLRAARNLRETGWIAD